MEKKTKQYKYLFGPVPSRRFGRSLGIDLTPYKTCSYDCVFCQLGPGERTTTRRKEYVPIDAVIEELRDWLEADGDANYITLSGSGEPTLHSHFGRILEYVKKNSDIPCLLLTNSSMLRIPEVREQACHADVVKISLSAWNQESLGWINRPNDALKFEEIIDGMKLFREQFRGQLWMEVFLVAGINSAPGDVEKIAALANEIQPDRIHLNTAIRPPAEEFVSAVSPEQMRELVKLFTQETEVTASFSGGTDNKIMANEDTILAMLRRRPCTADHISQVFGMHPNEVSKYTGRLLHNGKIQAILKDKQRYYSAAVL